MIFKNKIFIFILILLRIIPFCQSQSDTTFWFVAPDIAQKHNSNIFELPITFNIASFSNRQVNVKISQPASATFTTIYKTIPPNSSIEIDVSAYINDLENRPSNSILNKGILIETSDFVSIYYSINLGNADPESYSLKGQNALGTDFFIPGQNQYKNGGINYAVYEIAPYSKFDIVATIDNTSISILPTNNIIGHAAHIPFTIILNKGQSYSAVATSQDGNGHLAGSHIQSDKPIAITISDDLLGIDGTTCADLIGDQIVPISKIGTEYIVIKGQLNDNYDRVYLTATDNNTTVILNGSITGNATLSKGETKGFYYTSNSKTIYIITNKPVYCFQLTGIGCELGGAIVPSISCTGSNNIAYRRGLAVNQLFLNVFTHSSNISSFKINGNSSILKSTDFNNVSGTNGEWMFASKDISSIVPQYGLLTVNNTGLFHMATFDGNSNWGCSYNYFSDFKKNSEVAISMIKNTYCIGDEFEIIYSYKNLDKIECICPNGTVLKTPPFIIHSATINDSGKYIIKGEDNIGCNNIISDSIIIQVTPGILTTYFDTICQGEHYTHNGFDTIFLNSGTYNFDTINKCDTSRLKLFVTPLPYSYTYFDSICEGERYVSHGIDTVFYIKGVYIKYYSYKCDSLIKIQIYIKEAANVSLGKDIILCSDLSFPVKIDAGSDFTYYLWNTSEKTSYIYVNNIGDYYVSVTNKDGCKDSDTISVLLEKIPVKIEMLTSNFCDNYSATLQVNTQSDSIIWNTGETSQQIEITKSGNYFVKVIKSNCINTDTIQIDTCPFNLFLPNTIIPTHYKNHNDYFYLKLPEKHQIKLINIIIFDRWGNIVFKSKDIYFRWNGEIDGKPSRNNVFNYILQVTLEDERQYIYKGFILVL